MHANAQPKTRVEVLFHLLGLGAVVAILLAPQLFPACGGRLTLESTNHHCNKTFAVVTGIAFIALAVTIGSWFLGNSRLQIVFAGLSAGLAASVLALPRTWALGICRREDMACHQTELATAIPAAALLLVALALLIGASRKRLGQVPLLDPWDERGSEPSKAAVPATRRRKCCG
jgi:hypothetical protein